VEDLSFALAIVVETDPAVMQNSNMRFYDRFDARGSWNGKRGLALARGIAGNAQ
jgi:hypothetical protein